MKPRVKNPKDTILTSLLILIVLAVIATVFWPAITTSGIPSGVDTPSFLHTAKFMTDHLLAHGTLPPTDPQWYSGLEYLHYAPPLIYVPIGLAYSVTGNIRLAGKIFQIVIISLAALSMFFVVRKRHGSFSAAVAAVLFPLAPWTFFQLGSPTKLLAALFFPICFFFTEKVVEEKRNADIIMLACFFLIAVLSHPMMGLIFMAGMSIYAFVYTGLKKNLFVGRSVLIVIAALLGISLGAYFILPFYFEKAGWTVIPTQELINYSHPPDTVFLYTGIPIIALGLYAVLRHRDPRRIGLLVMGATGGFLSLGIFGAGFMYEILSFLKVTYPGLWLNLPIFAFSYLSATAFDFERFKGEAVYLKRGVVAASIVAVAVFATLPIDHFTQLNNKKSELADVMISKQLNKHEETGRVAPMKYPYGYLVWELSDRTTKNMTEGHYFGLSRIGKYLSWKYDAIDHGYVNYPFNFLANHNVRYLIVNGNLLKSREDYGKKFVRRLRNAGFKKKFAVSGYYGSIYDLYASTEKSSYLIPVTEKTLVIGTHAYTPAVVLSESEKALIGGSPYIDDYDAEVLTRFRTVILYGFAYRNREYAENLIKDFLKQGGQVIVDLDGTRLYGTEENPSFLGVTGHPRVAEGPFTIKKLAREADRYFAYDTFELPFELSQSGQVKERLKSWRYRVYVGLDEPIAALKEDNSDGIYSIAGFKHFEEGKVLFLGPNFFYHSYLTGNKRQKKNIARLTGNAVGHAHTAGLSYFDTETKRNNPRIFSQSVGPSKLSFKYTSKYAFPALISYAYSRHWQAYVDGTKIDTYNVEDLLFVNLPNGDHTLEVLYEDTKVHTFARAISLMTLLFFGWLFFKDRGKKKARQDEDG